MEQSLSGFNVANELQKYVCAALNASSDLSALGISAYMENARDIEFQIKNSLQKQGLALVVATPKLNLQGHDGNTNTYAIDELQILITEYVPVNRASNKVKFATALDLGTFCAEYLAGPSSPIGFGSMSFSGLEQGEDEGLLVVKCNFKCYAQGDFGGEFEPISGKIVISPYALQRDLEQLSSQLSSLPLYDYVPLSATQSPQQMKIWSLSSSLVKSNQFVIGQDSKIVEDQNSLSSRIYDNQGTFQFSIGAEGSTLSTSTLKPDGTGIATEKTLSSMKSEILKGGPFTRMISAESGVIFTDSQGNDQPSLENWDGELTIVTHTGRIGLLDETKQVVTELIADNSNVVTQNVLNSNLSSYAQLSALDHAVKDNKDTIISGSLSVNMLSVSNYGIRIGKSANTPVADILLNDSNEMYIREHIKPYIGFTAVDVISKIYPDGSDVVTQNKLTAYVQPLSSKVSGYTDTLLSGLYEDGTASTFYILTKAV